MFFHSSFVTANPGQLGKPSLHFLTQGTSTGKLLLRGIENRVHITPRDFGLCSDTTFPCLVIIFAQQRGDYQVAAENKHHRTNALRKGNTN